MSSLLKLLSLILGTFAVACLFWPTRVGAAAPVGFEAGPSLVIGGGDFSVDSPVPAVQQAEQVYALLGTLRAAQDQPFSTYLMGNDGKVYGLYGETPQVESQIAALQRQGPDLAVKVWGLLYAQGRQSAGPEIVVSSIASTVEDSAPGAPPVGNGSDDASVAPTATGRFEYVNLRSGPGSDFPVVGALVAGQTCPIAGRNEINSWLLLQCSTDLAGWVTSTVVELKGDVTQIPMVVVVPPTQATPVSPTFVNWKASYFANRELAGAPSLMQDVPEVNFDWGLGSPDPSKVPVDDFSARYERTLNYVPETYRLCLCNLDDGGRLWVDGQLLINDWREGAARDLYVDRQMGGDHQITVEYFEETNLASVRFTSEVALRARDEWEAKYWNNVQLEGPPALVRTEPRTPFPLDRNWGSGSPQPGLIGEDFWSASWRAIFYFESGDYTFNVISDDGVRVFIDGQRVVDAWQDGRKDNARQISGLSQGDHEITVEYYERTGEAYVRVWWYKDSQVRDE